VAKKQGRLFMNYDAATKKCYTSKTCSRPTPGTAVPWQTYKWTGGADVAPAPTPESGESGWTKFKPKHTKCERPHGEHPFVASDVEGCQGVAKKQGRLFMNYDAATKKCYTSRTCSRPTPGTAVPWQTYKWTGGADVAPVTPPPTRRLSGAGGWTKFKPKHTKCERPHGEHPFVASGVEGCQRVAEKQGRLFMNYDAHSKKCYPSKTCNKPTPGTSVPWQTYKWEEGADVEPAPEPEAASGGGWTKFKAKHTKCERPHGEHPFVVSGLEACQAKAKEQGRLFMNYDAPARKCYASKTCNKPAPTNAPWQTYKWEEPATPEPAPAPAKEEVWSKYLTAKTKCERPHGEHPFAVSGMEECGAKAKEQGRILMNYDAVGKKCYTSKTCKKPTKSSGVAWQIYKLKEVEVSPEPSPEEPEEPEETAPAPQWSKIQKLHMKCERPKGEHPFKVAGRSACEAKAEEQGRSFLTYDHKGKQCFTSVTCDKASGPTGVPWQIFQRSSSSALLAHTVESNLTMESNLTGESSHTVESSLTGESDLTVESSHTAESSHAAEAEDGCRPGVCTYEPQPAFFYHAAASSCREECDKISACTYYSYCPEANPECTGTHANRCAIFEKCSADDVRADIPGFAHAGHYRTCPRLGTDVSASWQHEEEIRPAVMI